MDDTLPNTLQPLWRTEDAGDGLVNVVHAETNLRLIQSCTKQAAKEAIGTLDTLGLTDDPGCLGELLAVRSKAKQSTPSETFSLALTARLNFTISAPNAHAVQRYAEELLTGGDTSFRVADLLLLCAGRDPEALGVDIVVKGPGTHFSGASLGCLTGGDIE
jgi:hypothetical protein